MPGRSWDLTGRGEWTSRTPAKGPQFELVEVSWQMRSQQTPPRTIECGIYRVNYGFEVRTTYQPDNRIYSQGVLDIRHARDLARASDNGDRLGRIRRFAGDSL